MVVVAAAVGATATAGLGARGVAATVAVALFEIGGVGVETGMSATATRVGVDVGVLATVGLGFGLGIAAGEAVFVKTWTVSALARSVSHPTQSVRPSKPVDSASPRKLIFINWPIRPFSFRYFALFELIRKQEPKIDWSGSTPIHHVVKRLSI